MPASGGAADKFGNWYEALWTIDQLLRIVDRVACRLILEPLEKAESRGVEFRVTNIDGTTDYWSVKRQTSKAAGWTVALLAAKDETGRSILGDLFAHVARAEGNNGVFASTLGAHEMEELRRYAANETALNARLDSSEELKFAFAKVVSLCSGNPEQARTMLLRVRTHAADEAQLRDRVEVLIRKLFYKDETFSVDAAAVRGHLSDLLQENIHLPIDRESILTALDRHGIRVREWALDNPVSQRISDICESYTAPLRSDMISGALLPLAPSDSILTGSGVPISQRLLVVGGAGSGKSTILADTIVRLRNEHIPVLVIRFDQIPDGILTTTELGRKLLLPESPTIVLAGQANGRSCALVIDQLDAVSMASGRRSELWALFDALRREAAKFPSMSLIVGCREFDLQHDPRMRTMRATGSGFSAVTLNPISSTDLDRILLERGVNPSVLQPTIKPILAVPLNLAMFLRLEPEARLSIRSRDELFNSFWTEVERRTDQRLGRKAAWTQVIDKLVNWLSTRQQLSAPKDVLDDFSVDAAAMASEHVLVLADGRYRFFHESFFDYAFARRFAAGGHHLSDLLLNGEQHLFRRAQVRQVLAYLRAQNFNAYLEELSFILADNRVRFHIKRVVLQWLSAMADPSVAEWNSLQDASTSSPELRAHYINVVAGQPAWFDVISGGFFEAALLSEDDKRVEEAIWFLSIHQVLESKSQAVASILKKHRKPGEKWKNYLRFICRYGDVYHSREIFDLFLSLIDDGTLDGVRPGFAVNDSWWTGLYSMAKERPDLASEAIAHWVDRVLSLWRAGAHLEERPAANSASAKALLNSLDRSGNGAPVIYMAAKSPQNYAEHMLPRLALFVEETAKKVPNHLDVDPIWHFRALGDNQLQVHSALLSALALSVEALAKQSPDRLTELLRPFQDRPHDVIAYLVLRAWTTAPQRYAEHIAEYLGGDTRRLTIGYSMWSGGGSAEIYVSMQAIKAASPLCSTEQFSRLEKIILTFTDPWEAKEPKRRGFKQLQLLQSLDSSRLSSAGSARLRELQRKFPKLPDPEKDPEPLTAIAVGSPISEQAQERMSDEQWLRAMRKYAGIYDTIKKPSGEIAGGELQLAFALEARAKSDPARFASLANRMSDDLPSAYFDAIIRGVANWVFDKNIPDRTISLEQAAALVRRAHALPSRPSGRSISDLVQRWKTGDWPDYVIETVSWYATNDPDPDQEAWKTLSNSGQPYYGGEPYTAGINSTRGAAAGAVQQLLFRAPHKFALLEDAICRLTHDKSVAVRSCAVGALLPLLNVDSKKAADWFRECVDTDPAILNTPYVHRFVRYAGYHDYFSVRPTLEVMLKSEVSDVVEAAAREISILALTVEDAMPDAKLVEKGNAIMRKAVAEVYAANVGNEAVGSISRQRLGQFLGDPEEAVRVEAASALHHIGELNISDQSDLLGAFLKGGPGPRELEQAVRALEDSPVQLPDLVCKLAESCVKTLGTEAGDVRTSAAAVAMDLSKIVVRLYSQTENKDTQSRCLDLIDAMERNNFMGLSDELRRLDR